MNKEITLRQIAFLYLFISIATIFRQVPETLALEAGRSGYLSPIWSIVATVPLTAIVLVLIKVFPGLNLYEIMVKLLGKALAKFIIACYLIWVLVAITAKVTSYTLTLQFTLMPKTKSNFFMVLLALLVFYALLRGMKTIFRFSEFTLSVVIILLIVIVICALTRIRTDYLLPVATNRITDSILASRHVIAVGGNIIIALFFADKLKITDSKAQYRKLWLAIVTFTIFAMVITVLNFGISGPNLTKDLPFPFYITVKSISFFNIFERFEVVITLICILSDFVAISVFAIILSRCFSWLFNLKESGFLFVPLTIIIYYLTYYLSSTQFEFNFLYRYIIVNVNLLFEYLIPFLLAFLCLIRKDKLKK